MRTLIQRVQHASVTIDGQLKSKTGKGLLVLVGIEDRDTQEDIEWLCKKIANLRIFDDENGVMNRSVTETEGEVMVVSQFSLTRLYKEGKPSFLYSMPPNQTWLSRCTRPFAPRWGCKSERKCRPVRSGPI